MAVLKTLMAYALCDTLGMRLTFDPLDNSLRGSAEHTVSASGLRFTVSSEVVSSWVTSATHAVIVKLVGNVALLAVANSTHTYGDLELHILNLAKMDQVKGWLEKEKPTSVNAILKRLGKAIVASFAKTGDKWEEV